LFTGSFFKLASKIPKLIRPITKVIGKGVKIVSKTKVVKATARIFTSKTVDLILEATDLTLSIGNALTGTYSFTIQREFFLGMLLLFLDWFCFP